MAAQLYRENGIQKIKYKGKVFTNRDILFDDEDYDKYEKKVKYQEPKMNSSSRPKVKQPYSFGTLEKFTKKDLDKYIRRIEDTDIEELILTPKYDGIGMMWIHGMCITRHDKSYGLDITYKLKNILSQFKIPENCVLRGELITRIEHKGYANRRTYVSSMVTAEEILPSDVEFICYTYLEQDKEGKIIPMTYEKMLIKIQKIFNFHHPAKKIKKEDLSVEILDDFMKKVPKEFKIDGVVIRPNEKEFVFEDKEQPEYQIGFKPESDFYLGYVKSITWTIKQEGYLQPTINLKDKVVIDGTNVKKATGVNFNYLYDQNIVPGKKCAVSLKVVSRIEGNENNQLTKKEYSDLIKPKRCPNCGGPVEIDKDSVERFKCKNYLNQCYTFTLLTKAKKVLKIPKFGKETIKKYAADKDFDFSKWLQEYEFTDKQLFMILEDGVDKKTIDKKFNRKRLSELNEYYGLDLY